MGSLGEWKSRDGPNKPSLTSHGVWPEVDGEVRRKAYEVLTTTLFECLEVAATSNEKYQDVVRIENYYYFATAVQTMQVW